MTTLIISHLGSHGDGIAARPDGKPLFVPGAAPGDTVVLDDAGAVQTIMPGPHRAVPPCRHFGSCGGCQLQHIDGAAYAAWLGERILAALSPLGIVPEQVMAPHVSPPGSRRRASLRAVKRSGRVALGFSEKGAHTLVDLAECPVLHASLVGLLAPLRALLASLLREKQSAGVQLTLTDTGVDLIVQDLDRLGLDAQQDLAAFANEHGVARLSVGGAAGLDLIAESRTPVVRFDGLAVGLPPGGFLQATRDGEAALQQAVRDAVGEARTIADLFCGLGTFAVPLAQRAKVHGVDGAAAPVKALERAARQAGLALTTEHRDLFRRPLKAADLARFEAVVLDPPRTGAMDQTVEVAAARVPCVVTVSCNPNTFARDAERLVKAGYGLRRLWPIGQFLWSTHVELVGEFRLPR
jgi:23S rRNA (uracil1939-C5)-methyltransferase